MSMKALTEARRVRRSAAAKSLQFCRTGGEAQSKGWNRQGRGEWRDLSPSQTRLRYPEPGQPTGRDGRTAEASGLYEQSGRHAFPSNGKSKPPTLITSTVRGSDGAMQLSHTVTCC